MSSASDVIEFGDLAAPRLTEAQRQILDYTESRPVDLDIATMLAEARMQAGVDDLDDTDGFSDRLAAHVAAIEADTGLTQLARMTLRARVVRLLRNRLSLTDLIKRYPEIESIPIDPRYARVKAEHDALMASTPLVAAMHDRYPEAIEEEVEILDLDLASYVLEWHARVPDWRDYYLGLDQTRHYAYLKKVLQALTFLRGPRAWVLKSPQHCEQLGPLMATFPDATVAFTHRDPVAVIQSAITMMAYGDRMRRTSIDPDWLLDYWTDRVHRLLSACVRDRELVPADRSIDVAFHHLNGNELPLLEQLYARGGVELTSKARKRFEQYLDSNPRGKHGHIRYDLQRHFGVSAEDLRGRFDFYFDRFDVRPES